MSSFSKDSREDLSGRKNSICEGRAAEEIPVSLGKRVKAHVAAAHVQGKQVNIKHTETTL